MKVTCSGLLVPELTYADTEVYLVQFLADFGTRKKVGGKGNARLYVTIQSTTDHALMGNISP